MATFLIYQTRRTLGQILGSLLPSRPGIVDPATRGGGNRSGLFWRKVALGLGLLAVVFMAAAGYWTVALLLVLLTLAELVTWDLLDSGAEASPFAVIPLALLGLALAIGIGVDLVRLNGDIGRMNTFFKLSLQVWVLLSVSAAYMLWSLGARGFFTSGVLTGSEVSGWGYWYFCLGPAWFTPSLARGHGWPTGLT